MKQVLAIILVLILTSCSPKLKETTNDSKLLLGEWRLVQAAVAGGAEISQIKNPNLYIIEFRKDKKLNITVRTPDKLEIYSGKYKILKKPNPNRIALKPKINVLNLQHSDLKTGLIFFKIYLEAAYYFFFYENRLFIYFGETEYNKEGDLIFEKVE